MAHTFIELDKAGLQDGRVKDVCSSPARTPKLQLAAEEPLTGERWISAKKRYPTSKGKAEAPVRWFSSIAYSCLTLCDPVNRSTPGLFVHQQLPKFTQIHVHRVSDAIQPSHPLSSPSPPAPNSSQH